MQRASLIPSAFVALFFCSAVHAANGAGSGAETFAQLDYLLPTPTETRLASGAPGPQYWQQRADYNIKVTLDDAKQRITGSESVTYHNQSPHTLKYLWVQLDQNRFQPDSDDVLTRTAPDFEDISYSEMADLLAREEFDGGHKIKSVKGADGKPLSSKIVKTMMRIDLPQPLKPGGSFVFNVDWEFNVVDAMKIGTRGGYEYFEKDGNYIYEIAQWYPRVAAYTDYQGWQHKQFLGRGEFTLELGNFDVAITVPRDFVVAATGVLQNADEVLTNVQRERLEKARAANKPMFVITPDEARRNEATKEGGSRTWKFQAGNVRDFAFAASRKFIWDAMGVTSGDIRVLAMSFYPNEAEPLWSTYSTQAVAHTIENYSKYTFNYPYPVAISVNGPEGGMEYPMICFNGPRPYPDKTYWDVSQGDVHQSWERSKYGLISVVIHEVGHNYFPMIVNSDERQWTWMDEGLNTFLQFLAEQSWEENYPSRRGEPRDIVDYMVSVNKVPIMTQSDSILQFGNNAYGKPATALNILRESILGRDLFDYAFREYAERWRFKRPTPADFFRSMEDASGVDLDWFWRGWFYGTGHVEISIDKVTEYVLDTRDPQIDKTREKTERDAEEPTLSEQRNKGMERRVERFPELKDFYNSYDELDVTPQDYADYQKMLKELEAWEHGLLKTDKHFYAVDFRNIGGLVMPLPLRITYADGKTEMINIPAEIWRRNSQQVSKLIISDKEILSIELDPFDAIADADESNNHYPRQPVKTRFELFKEGTRDNPMRQARDAKK